jgi:hypothetical protein
MPSPVSLKAAWLFWAQRCTSTPRKKSVRVRKNKNQTRKASPRHRPVLGPSVASNPPLPDCPAAAPKLPHPPIPSRRRAPTPPPLLLPPILGSRTAAPCTSSGRRAPTPPPNLGMGMLGSGTVHLEEHAWDPRLLVASADQSLTKKSPAANPPSSPPPSPPTPSRCFLASRRGVQPSIGSSNHPYLPYYLFSVI